MRTDSVTMASSWRQEIGIATQRFSAWWEGYAFDEAAARQRVDKRNRLSDADEIALQIWGAGRLDPGSQTWTMRHARTLGLDSRAHVAVLGAGAGAPLADLRKGAHWKANGFSSFAGKKASGLRHYDEATAQLNKRPNDGAMCFFDLHRDNDPSTLALFAAELVKPGSPVSFVDFTLARPVRLSSCFSGPWAGTPRTIEETAMLLEGAGLKLVDFMDESRGFAPLVLEGWSRWRAAYDAGKAIVDPGLRANRLSTLANFARLWAERLDAIKAGQLQVTRLQTRRIR